MINKKKRILFFITDLGGGGAERVLVNLANNINKKQYDVTIQTLFDVGTNRKYIDKTVKYIGGIKKQFRGNVFLMKLFSPQVLYKMFIKESYDVIIAFLEGPPARIVSGCTDCKVKKIAWVHGESSSYKQLAYAFGSKKKAEHAYNSMNRIICVADTVKTNLVSLLNINVPIETLYNVNESDKIRRKSNDSIDGIFNTEDLKIISVGRLIDVKGFDRLVRVHKRLLDSGIKHQVFVLGTGEKKETLEKQISQNNVGETFHLLGFSENPYKYVAKADLFVCSSRREGFSTAVTEALILGVPVVSTKVSGAYELLGENDEYGIVTDNDEDALYYGVKKLLESPSLLQHYRNQADERGKHFNKEETIKAVENMVEKLFEE